MCNLKHPLGAFPRICCEVKRRGGFWPRLRCSRARGVAEAHKRGPRDVRFQCPHVPPPASSFPEGLLRAHCLSSASHACLSHYKRPCDQWQRARALVALHVLTSRVTLTDCVNSSESIPICRGPACTPSPGGFHEAQTAGSSEIRKTESGKQHELSGCQPLLRAPEKLPRSVSCGCKSGGTRPSTVPVPLA